MAISADLKKQLDERRKERGAIVIKTLPEITIPIKDGFNLIIWFEKLNNQEICCFHLECKKCDIIDYRAASQEIKITEIYERCLAHISSNHDNFIIMQG